MADEAPMAQFRVTLDVPHSFAVEPGFVRNQHCHDFRQKADTARGTWQDPNTGLIMLEPSFLNESFHGSEYWKPLDQWIYSQNFWEKVYRSGDPLAPETALFFTSVGHNNSDTIEAIADTEVAILSLESALSQDQVVPAMQSQFALSRDEGFVWYYRATGDENHHYKNWFTLQWDNLGIAFSYDGRVRVYLFGIDKTIAPQLIDDFEICLPSDIVNNEGYFVILPMPGYGINIYHSRAATRLSSRVSSAQSGVSRGHLVHLERRFDNDGNLFVHNGGVLRVGVGLRIDRVHHKFGYHQINYSTDEQSWIEDVFDPGYIPTFGPAEVNASKIPNGVGIVTCSLLKPKSEESWAAGSDRQGRVKVAMQTIDPLVTPYVLGTNVYFAPKFSVRNTTPVLLDSTSGDTVWRLEFSEDELNTFSGVVMFKAQSGAARAIVERGDATFQIEKSLDGGATWTVHNGGLAKFPDEVHIEGDEDQGIYYVATATLSGMEGRFDEHTQFLQMAFDGTTPGDAINVIHATCGLESIDPLPAELIAYKIPGVPQGQNYRFAPKAGDRGDEIIRQLLFLMRKQFVEWRHWYDWKNGKWLIDKRPRDTDPAKIWTLTPFEDEAERQPTDAAGKRDVLFGSGDGPTWFPFRVMPPEANVLQPYGASSPDASGELIPGTPIYNRPSLSDKTSPEYLGRAVVAGAVFAPISDANEIERMGQRVFDAACHRAVEATIPACRWVDALTPGKPVKIRSLSFLREREFFMNGLRFWIKRRTVVLNYLAEGEEKPVVTYAVSSIWESPIK